MGEWNVEVFGSDIEGINQKPSYYFFNLSESTSEKLETKIYRGDFPINETEQNETHEYVGSFEIIVTGEQEGSLIFTDPEDIPIIEYTFIETYKNFVGAFGIFNESFRYSVNIINLATIHISLYSFSNRTFKELLLTRIQTYSYKPWYSKYQQIFVAIAVFVITFGLLKICGPSLDNIGKIDTRENKETKRNKNKKNKNLKIKKTN